MRFKWNCQSACEVLHSSYRERLKRRRSFLPRPLASSPALWRRARFCLFLNNIGLNFEIINVYLHPKKIPQLGSPHLDHLQSDASFRVAGGDFNQADLPLFVYPTVTPAILTSSFCKALTILFLSFLLNLPLTSPLFIPQALQYTFVSSSVPLRHLPPTEGYHIVRDTHYLVATPLLSDLLIKYALLHLIHSSPSSHLDQMQRSCSEDLGPSRCHQIC